MDKYRIESGKVYEYSKEHNGYLYIGNLNGRNLKQFLHDKEEMQEYYASLDLGII